MNSHRFGLAGPGAASVRAATLQDPGVLCAWREQLTSAALPLTLKQQLRTHEQALLLRFAAHYMKLRVLPRRVRRALRRQWKRSLAGVALLMTLGAGPAVAATINVVDGTCTAGRCHNGC